MHGVQKETPRWILEKGNGMPIDHWSVKNKFNGTQSNLKSKTNGGNRSIFVTSNVGGCIIASVNSNLSPRGGKGRDRIVDRKEFSGQLSMIHALMIAMLFLLRFHIANTTFACSKSGYPLIYDLKWS